MLPIRNTDERWGMVTVGIHWLTVLAVLGLCVVGFLMQELPNKPFKFDVYMVHKSLGLAVLALTVLRLLWRLLVGVPQPVPGMPRWQQLAASGTHALLYVVLLAMPLSGWLLHSATPGFPLHWFGTFAVPKLVGGSRDIADFAEEAHETLFLVLAALVTMHALAALKHHYFDRDRTLHRMLPMVPPPQPAVAVEPGPMPGA